MNGKSIAYNGLYFQTEFSDNSEAALRKSFCIERNEKIFFALYLSPVKRSGFIFSDKALHWNFSGGGVIPKTAKGKLKASFDQFIDEDDRKFCKITLSGKELLIRKINDGQAQKLLELIKSTFDNQKIPDSEELIDAKPLPLLNARGGLDAVFLFTDSLSKKFSAVMNGDEGANAAEEAQEGNAEAADNSFAEESGAEEKTEEEEQDEDAVGEFQSAEEPENQEAKKEQGGASEGYKTFGELSLLAFLTILEIAASLIFIAAIVIALKPELLKGNPYETIYKYTSFAEKIGTTLIKVKILDMSSNLGNDELQKILILKNCLCGAALIVFGLLKILIFLLAKNKGQKIISALTLAMTFLACFMLSDKFLLFLIFILLLHICFGYSCRFPTNLIFTKLAVVMIAATAIYVAVVFALDSNLVKAAEKIFTALEFKSICWW